MKWGGALKFCEPAPPRALRRIPQRMRHIYTKDPHMTTISDDRAAARIRTADAFARTLGPRWRGRVATALEMDPSAVRRWFAPPKARDDAPPAGVQAVAEFLDSAPTRYWPDRWK